MVGRIVSALWKRTFKTLAGGLSTSRLRLPVEQFSACGPQPLWEVKHPFLRGLLRLSENADVYSVIHNSHKIAAMK